MKVILGILLIVIVVLVVMFLPAAILSLLLTQLGSLHAPLLSIWECWCFLTSVAIVGTAFGVASVHKSDK
jgi:hypothetical protein